MMLRVIDAFSADPNDGIAFDAALFREMEAGRGTETLRFWECDRPAVVVGALGAVSRQVNEDASFADNVPVIRRISGGGAVVIGRGCLNYALVLSMDERPELRQVGRSYRLILARIVEALNLYGLAVRGLSDLALRDRKVSGNAQRRGRRALLHHGTMLYDFDIGSMNRYLKEPYRQPDYRRGRAHAAFVTNVPLGPDVIRERIIRACGRSFQ